METDKPNPLTQHLMSLVEGRQQAEVAKLTLLTQLLEQSKACHAELGKLQTAVAELIERTKR